MQRLPDGTAVAETRRMRSTVSARDPADASAEGETRVRRRHRGSTTECVAAGVLTSSAAAFHLTVSLEVRVEDCLHFQRHWTASFPRLLL